MTSPNFSVKKESKANSYQFAGRLTIDTMVEARGKLQPLLKEVKGKASCDLSALSAMDTAGALLLKTLREEASKRGLTLDYSGLETEEKHLFELVADADTEAHMAPPKPVFIIQLLQRLGKGSIRAWHSTLETLTFFGQTSVVIARVFTHPKHLRLPTLSRHVDETGIAAIPIIALMAFLISVVLAYQGASQLRPLGAERFTVNLVAVSVLREMGVLLTAIMVAGRSGSAFTAEIGVMKVTEEVDALRVIGIDPFEYLVVPRILALMITLPILAFISDIVGILGGGVVCNLQLGMPWVQYFTDVRHAAHGHDFFAGMIKAPVFAFIIALVGSKHGMDVSGSAESVGTLTTAAVVRSIFLVIVADAFFSILFSKIGI